MEQDRLVKILDSMVGKRVLVIGDLMLDEYVWGNVRRISPEAPVMVVEVQRDSSMPGGAANVVNNIQALGGIASIIGVIGDDHAGSVLMSHLAQNGVDTNGIVIDKSRPTTRKTRIVAHSQQVVRVDRESRIRLAGKTIKELLAKIDGQIKTADIIVFSDYEKGMAGSVVTKALLELAIKYGKSVVVNPKPANVLRFKSATLISMNQSELEISARMHISCERDLQKAAKRLINTLRSKALLVTRGPDGMSLFKIDGKSVDLPAHLVEVYDVAGAGDTVVSVLALAMAVGADFSEAAIFANCAGGAVVRKVGVATVTRDEIAAMIKTDIAGVTL